MRTLVDLRIIYKKQLEFCTEIAKDIIKHSASKEICEYASNYACIEHPYDQYSGFDGDFIRVNFGECYVYIYIYNNYKPVGKILYNNDEMGIFEEDYTYEGTLKYLDEVSKEKIYSHSLYSDCYDEYVGNESKYVLNYIPFNI